MFPSGHAFAFSQGGEGHRVGEIGVAGCFAGFRFHQQNSFHASDIKYLVGNVNALDFVSSCTGFEWYLRIRKIWGCSNTSGDVCAAMVDNSLTRVMGVAQFDIDEVKGCNYFGTATAAAGIGEMRFNNTVFASNQFDVRPCACGLVFGFNTAIDILKCSAGSQRYKFTKYGQVADDHRNYFDDTGSPGGQSTVISATDQRHTAADFAWKFNPKTANITQYKPLWLPIARIACNAAEARTVSVWVRRDNTALSMRLKCRGGQIAGVASDVTDDAAGAVDTWEQLSITFTPSEKGVVEIRAEAWGGTAYSGWVDDLSVS